MKTFIFCGALMFAAALILTGCEDDNAVEPYEPLPQVAFVYQPETNYNTPLQFETMLESHGYITTLVEMDSIVTTDFTLFDLTIIDSKIGSGDNWGASSQVTRIMSANKPILGIGFGGARFFGENLLAIGWDNGEPFLDTTSTSFLNTDVSVDDIKIHLTDTLFYLPNAITRTNDSIIEVYNYTGTIVIEPPSPAPDSMKYYGRQPNYSNRYAILQEGPRYLLWGFTNGPNAMTTTGQSLFLNVVDRLVNLEEVTE
ncbi:MAG: hypothetical protein JW763_06550 [candidate division Zixibacteria bacterium]|nr:hypothetical protein [candidate division Zixibacteria bacterium]